MLSNSCRYGIRAVIYLANQPKSAGKTGIKIISKDLGLPMPFLAKILQQLAKQKILSSTKGPHGGFSILKDPKKITLYEIVNSIDGDGIFTNCVMHNGSCTGTNANKNHCPLHDDYQNTRSELINLFRKRTIYELVQMVKTEELISI
jgi:Rrf2 family transcriptional regulator, iron-sulfur cluster assembly transcription factor